MPALLNTLALNEFFNGQPIPLKALNDLNSNLGLVSPFGKSIQKSYRFLVTFFPNMFLSAQRPQIFKEIGPMPLVRSFHIQSISIPQYTFTKETQYYGNAPRSFPILKHDGFEVKIEFEEDDHGTIGFFISWLQRLAIEPSKGYYTPPDFVKLPLISVITETDNGTPIAVYTLHDAFYLTATGPDLNYSDSASIKYSITFNVDVINSFFPQAKIFQQLINAISGIVGV